MDKKVEPTVCKPLDKVEDGRKLIWGLCGGCELRTAAEYWWRTQDAVHEIALPNRIR